LHITAIPINQLSVLSLLWGCTSIFVRLVCFNKASDYCAGNLRAISTLFKTFFSHFGSRHFLKKNNGKMSGICIHFCRLVILNDKPSFKELMNPRPIYVKRSENDSYGHFISHKVDHLTPVNGTYKVQNLIQVQF
jgi:hypothetical protein